MNERSRSAFLNAQLESLRQERSFRATFRPLTDLHPWVCAHRLMIRDEGKGMDADYIHALNSGAPLPRDTVSGHYVVRKVLSMYRSTFFVWSQVDAGACFEIDFLR